MKLVATTLTRPHHLYTFIKRRILWLNCLTTCMLLICASACSDRLDNLTSKVEDLDNRIDVLEDAVKELTEAYSNGKVITSVVNSDNCYIVTFSDNSNIVVRNGLDGSNGSTPKVYIDKDGFWAVTYDDGNTSELIVDTYGNPISARGINGDNGLCVRVVINSEGYYVYESYYPDKADEVINVITTPFTSDKSNIIASIVQNDLTHIITITMQDGSAFNFEQACDIKLPEIISFSFRSTLNPRVLLDDVYGTINNNIIECRIPHIVDSKLLIPSIVFEGESVAINNAMIDSDKTCVDWSKPVEVVVTNKDGQDKSYIVNVRAFTGLPIVYVNTENNTPVTSKDDYLNASIRIVEDIHTKVSGDVFESSVRIKGRGNSTWTMSKKPYKLKFDKKTSLLGEPEDKEWVLLANFSDKTSIRNELAFWMGRELSDLEYTCRTHYVELILNNEYLGTYQLGEQQKISKDRVNVGDNGYLLEIDAKAAEDDITFKLGTISVPINIKDPEVELGSEEYNRIVDFMTKAEAALFSKTFLDEQVGYANYIDIPSFVEWYLINEISKNNDAFFYSSCYMNYNPEIGKIKMGPLWDFDLAFGNVNYNGNESPEGFWIKKVTWFEQLFKDPYFVSFVKSRYNYYYSQMDMILNEINNNYSYLYYSTKENENKWGTLYKYTWPNYVVLGSYENEVSYLKSWLIQRMEWLKTEFDKM